MWTKHSRYSPRATSQSFTRLRFRHLTPLVIAFVAVAVPAFADGPLLHEYVPYDPSSDGELGAVTTEGGFAAEMLTRSGKITAPDPSRPISKSTPLYGSKAATPNEFTPDRDTRRVDVLPYDEPFRPRVAPFKRMTALDVVKEDYTLAIRPGALVAVDIDKDTPAREPVDVFYADIALDVHDGGEPIRIPTPVAGTAIKKAHLSPALPFKLSRDKAENLFIVVEGSGPARLVLELASPRDAFAGETGASYDWADLPLAMMPTLPSAVQRAADVAAKEIGIDRGAMKPSQAVRKMVAYFRAFKESDDPPAKSGDIYLDLVRSKKGVCRHRAFAFMVTSLGLGIPTRFIENEAHAWVEVHDGYMWRRIDLGGSGRALDDKSEKPDKPQPSHDPPTDPYAWPSDATKGSDLVPPSSGGPTGPGTSPSTPPTMPPPVSSGTSTTAAPSKVSLTLPDLSGEFHETARAKTIAVKGKLNAGDGSVCKHVRVEIVLKSGSSGVERIAGVLATDDFGGYEGKVTVPSDLPVGDYVVSAHTPGGGLCGQGSSE